MKLTPSAVRRMSLTAEFGPEAVDRSTPCWRMEAGGDRAKVYIYDVIGGWDLDAGEFVKDLHAMTATTIDLHINSPGGFVYDAVAMFEAIADHPARVVAHVDGLAASAASVLAMAGDEIEIARGGRMMIHDAQVIAYGSPADLREAADLGDAVSDDIAGYYANRAGGTPKDWRAAMTATTWYSAAQAVDAKLADRVTGGAQPEDRATQLIRARARVALGGVR